MRNLLGAVLVLCMVWGSAAQAGRRAFVLGQDTAFVPEGDVEVETWVDFDWSRGATNQWAWWVGPRWAPIDGLEVTALTEFVQGEVPNVPLGAQLWGETIEFRWRFIDLGQGGFLTAQLDGRIPMVDKLQYTLAPTVGWNDKLGRFSLMARIGYQGSFRNETTPDHRFLYDVGVAVDAVRGDISPLLQFGVEAVGGIGNTTPLEVGPSVSICKGRLWFTLGALFGVTDDAPKAVVRGVIGVAL